MDASSPAPDLTGVDQPTPERVGNRERRADVSGLSSRRSSSSPRSSRPPRARPRPRGMTATRAAVPCSASLAGGEPIPGGSRTISLACARLRAAASIRTRRRRLTGHDASGNGELDRSNELGLPGRRRGSTPRSASTPTRRPGITRPGSARTSPAACRSARMSGRRSAACSGAPRRTRPLLDTNSSSRIVTGARRVGVPGRIRPPCAASSDEG